MADPTHSYYDWQVSTLMLAYDVIQPLARTDEQQLAEREIKVKEELRQMVHAVLPPEYLRNPQVDFPPQIVAILTRATLERAISIIEGTGVDFAPGATAAD
jgi:hypothetical protein